MRKPRRRRTHPGDAVGEAAIGQVLVAEMAEFAAPVVGPAAVDLHDDEAMHGQLMHGRQPRCPSLLHEGIVRPGVDVFDDGILLRGIEVRRHADDPVDVEFPVPVFCREGMGETPTGGSQGRGITARQHCHQPAIAPSPQFGHRRAVHPRMTTNIVFPSR